MLHCHIPHKHPQIHNLHMVVSMVSRSSPHMRDSALSYWCTHSHWCSRHWVDSGEGCNSNRSWRIPHRNNTHHHIVSIFHWHHSNQWDNHPHKYSHYSPYIYCSHHSIRCNIEAYLCIICMWLSTTGRHCYGCRYGMDTHHSISHQSTMNHSHILCIHPINHISHNWPYNPHTAEWLCWGMCHWDISNSIFPPYSNNPIHTHNSPTQHIQNMGTGTSHMFHWY